jgi:integrase
MAIHQRTRGASLELQKDWFRVVLRYNGVKYQRALNTQDPQEAEGLRSRVAENLKLLKRGRLEYRPGDDLVTVLLSDGKLNSAPAVARQVSLGRLLKDYRKRSTVGKEENTRYTERIHIKHLLRVFGRRTLVGQVPAKLQEYINERAKDVRHETIRKELGTLSSIWNRWALREKLVHSMLTLRNLMYPKKKEKPRFETWKEIERRIARGKLRNDEIKDLWDCLYLTVEEVEELLSYLSKTGCLIRGKRHDFLWVLPMVAFCAYTGARRSEMLRSELQDLDFDKGEIAIREKKKEHDKELTLRHVPMVPQLRVILEDWLKVHPGGHHTFSKIAGEPFTAQMATHYLRWAIDGSKWEVVKGFHTLRHGFVSNLASKGVSERVIMRLAGHLNSETTKRYAHLLPSTVDDAMQLVFGKQRRLDFRRIREGRRSKAGRNDVSLRTA